MDVTNPGLVNVVDQVVGNPDPNGGTVLLVPEQLDFLTDADAQGYPPAENGVDATVFPTPTDVTVTELPTVPTTGSEFVPPAEEVDVQDQDLELPDPAEFLVVGPAESFQTNSTTTSTVDCEVTAIYDADKLWSAPTPTTTRYLLVVGPPALTSYPVSMLGRQIIFADDTLTTEDAGAARLITGYSTNYLVINQNDPNDLNVPVLTTPQVGDTFSLDVQRQGSEQVNTTSSPTANVFIQPPPPTFEPNSPQGQNNTGNVGVSTGPQPGNPIITSGVGVPNALFTVNIADTDNVIGLPVNVFV